MGDPQLSAHCPKFVGTIGVEDFDGVCALELLGSCHGVLCGFGRYRVYLEHAGVQVTNGERLPAVVNADHFDPFTVDVISGDDIPQAWVGRSYAPATCRTCLVRVRVHTSQYGFFGL